MIKPMSVPVFDMMMCVSDALDLVSHAVTDHHKRVAYIASAISQELGMAREDQRDLVVAGSLHDAGAISLKERLDILNFEFDSPYRHAELGYILLRKSRLFRKIAPIVRFHHVKWEYGKGTEFRGDPVPMGSHILHLADRIAVLINRSKPVLGQMKDIIRKIEEEKDRMFVPEFVKAFVNLAKREYFWYDSVSFSIESILHSQSRLASVDLYDDDLLDLARLFSRIIDFRSRFTAIHSSGIAACAEALAGFAGFSKSECHMMRIAGYLHDLGKLAVPAEILEKPGKLTEDEFNVIRCHTYYTFRILERLPQLYTISTWAAFHHERLDGSGYPFHYRGDDIPLGSRIMAVSDIFTAIVEDRPYRKGMSPEAALDAVENMAVNATIDRLVVSLLRQHLEDVNGKRMEAQRTASKEYLEFDAAVNV